MARPTGAVPCDGATAGQARDRRPPCIRGSRSRLCDGAAAGQATDSAAFGFFSEDGEVPTMGPRPGKPQTEAMVVAAPARWVPAMGPRP